MGVTQVMNDGQDNPKKRMKHVPGTTEEIGRDTHYRVAPCGAVVRVTPKMEPGVPPSHEHNNSRRRRRQKGKF